jgi:hypothetical protein
MGRSFRALLVVFAALYQQAVEKPLRLAIGHQHF